MNNLYKLIPERILESKIGDVVSIDISKEVEYNWYQITLWMKNYVDDHTRVLRRENIGSTK